MNARRHRLLGLAAAALLAAPAGHAGIVDDVLGPSDFSSSWSGFLRNENAVKITNDQNPFNQRGNLFNGVPVERNGGPVALSPIVLMNDTVVRPVPTADNTFNMEMVRAELNGDVGLFSNLRLKVKLRAVGDPDIYDDQFDVDDTPTADPVGRLNSQAPNFYEYRYDSGKAIFPSERSASGGRGGEPYDTDPAREARERAKLEAEEGSSPLEWAGNDYMVDLPAFYLDYQNGPLLIRAGNQQIAWGDLLFFRIMDVPNGLDLRRHQLLDFVSEEFSDKRVPSLGIRTSYMLGGWEIDSYVQRFRPTIYPNPNTPYNVIPSQFTVHDQFKQYDDEYNYGLRMRGSVNMPFLGPMDLTLMANRRYNHFGIFQWTDSDVDQPLDPDGPAGVGINPVSAPFVGAFGPQLADSVFEQDPTGVVSAEEFYTYGAIARLNHLTGLNKAITEFPGAQDATAQPASNAAEQERQEDLFLQLSGGLRGHIRREYHRENNFGLGLSYRIEGPQDSILFDQINASIEAKYTPDRHYTPTDLDPFNPIVEDEYEIGLVFQKFVRYSATFPAAFAVLQYLHRSESDIFNRHLSGYGGDPGANDPEDRLPDGISSANYVAFAFQQPFPNRIWRIDFAALYDVKGGLLVQPALRWKPNSAWTFQVFANFIDTVHGNPYDNTLSTVDFADEVTTRVEYQF